MKALRHVAGGHRGPHIWAVERAPQCMGEGRNVHDHCSAVGCIGIVLLITVPGRYSTCWMCDTILIKCVDVGGLGRGGGHKALGGMRIYSCHLGVPSVSFGSHRLDRKVFGRSGVCLRRPFGCNGLRPTRIGTQQFARKDVMQSGI